MTDGYMVMYQCQSQARNDVCWCPTWRSARETYLDYTRQAQANTGYGDDEAGFIDSIEQEGHIPHLAIRASLMRPPEVPLNEHIVATNCSNDTWVSIKHGHVFRGQPY